MEVGGRRQGIGRLMGKGQPHGSEQTHEQTKRWREAISKKLLPEQRASLVEKRYRSDVNESGLQYIFSESNSRAVSICLDHVSACFSVLKRSRSSLFFSKDFSSFFDLHVILLKPRCWLGRFQTRSRSEEMATVASSAPSLCISPKKSCPCLAESDLHLEIQCLLFYQFSC